MSKLDAMREAGSINRRAIDFGLREAKPGMTKAVLDRAIGEYIRGLGAEPAFLGYHGFPSNCCLSLNEELVHGTASDRVINDGDILTVDCGVRVGEYCVDAAGTTIVGNALNEDDVRLVKHSKELIDRLIDHVQPGLNLFDFAMQCDRLLAHYGLKVFSQFCGHGIGKSVHEPPQINHTLVDADHTFLTSFTLRKGMTICVEPITTFGGTGFRVLDEDGWTCVSVDGSRSAHFEHCILVVQDGCEILC